ncbi:MAG: IS21 family transposase [Micromonosporaceae bacterium]|nr:IS21 family transposase [Micromonosporaceae bacterium]
MARRSFTVVDVTEILIHWYAGRSLSEVSDSLGVDRKTIRKYLAPAVAAGMSPGGPPVSQAQWAVLVTDWFPQLMDTTLRQTTWPEIAKHHQYITTQLKAGVTQATIHQRLRDEHGLVASLASLKRYVAANLSEEVRREQVVVLRDPVDPGAEAQIDYGKLGMWTDPATGRRRTVWAFAMVLACSRHLFVRPVLVMDQRAWTQAHVEAFAFFGGVPARVVPDNLRTGVAKTDLYDPKINRSYAELAAHYGVLVDPARRGKPRDKPRVERPMPYIRDSFWRGREFTSLAAMQAEAVRWCSEVAGRRSCRPLEGAAPASVFAAVEAEALAPLPSKPFVLATWSTALVGPDIHAKVGKTIYSVPWRLIGQRLDARETDTMVQLFHQGQLVATHGRKPKGKQTDFGHYPPEKIAFRMRTPTWCRTRAEQIGPAATEVIAGLLEVNALFRLRAAQGVLGLADKHGTARLEAACAKAIAAGDPAYRTVKGILAAGAETDPPGEPAGDGGAAAHLHGPSQLFADVLPLSNADQPDAQDTSTAGEHYADAGHHERNRRDERDAREVA